MNCKILNLEYTNLERFLSAVKVEYNVCSVPACVVSRNTLVSRSRWGIVLNNSGSPGQVRVTATMLLRLFKNDEQLIAIMGLFEPDQC